MDVARGERKARLPLAVIELALEMFAGSTGFSGPEIHRFFAEYDASIPDYAWGGGSPSRKELFRRFLQGFPVERQRQILVDACHYEGPMKYGRPSPKERRRLLTMLEGVHAPALQDVRTIAERLDWRWVLREWGGESRCAGIQRGRSPQPDPCWNRSVSTCWARWPRPSMRRATFQACTGACSRCWARLRQEPKKPCARS